MPQHPSQSQVNASTTHVRLDVSRGPWIEPIVFRHQMAELVNKRRVLFTRLKKCVSEVCGLRIEVCRWVASSAMPDLPAIKKLLSIVSIFRTKLLDPFLQLMPPLSQSSYPSRRVSRFREVLGRPQYLEKPQRINIAQRIRIRILISRKTPARQPNRIALDVSTRARVIRSEVIVMQPRFLIEILARES